MPQTPKNTAQPPAQEPQQSPPEITPEFFGFSKENKEQIKRLIEGAKMGFGIPDKKE